MTNKGKKKRVLLLLVYAVFLVTLFEGSARLVFLVPQFSERLWEDEDYSWRRMWVRGHRESSQEMLYTFDVYDPSKGWMSKPNLRDMKVFGNKVLNTNSRGLRAKQEYSYRKDRNKVRILILGDSFTFGAEVSDDETYPYCLQQMLPHVEVINMGVHGYGHDQMLILLREEGLKYQPDIVMLGFLPMDMPRNLLQFRDYAKPKFVLDNGELKLTGTPVPRPEEVLKWDWLRPRTVDVFAIIRHKFRKSVGLYEKEKQQITTAILTEIIELTDSIHAIPIFVYLPSGDEIYYRPPFTRGEKFLFSVCRANDKVRCFSTRPYFVEKVAKGIFFEVGHWDYAGHLTVAEAIKDYLVDQGYVAPPQSLGNSDLAEPDK